MTQEKQLLTGRTNKDRKEIQAGWKACYISLHLVSITILSRLFVLCSSFSSVLVVEAQPLWLRQRQPSRSALKIGLHPLRRLSSLKAQLVVMKYLIKEYHLLPVVFLNCIQCMQELQSASLIPLPRRSNNKVQI